MDLTKTLLRCNLLQINKKRGCIKFALLGYTI